MLILVYRRIYPDQYVLRFVVSQRAYVSRSINDDRATAYGQMLATCLNSAKLCLQPVRNLTRFVPDALQ